ncbi:hypothetical protein SAMN05421743_101459 [Thalassobacillus cyri]|uniref:Nuclease-related domain-containing protein n=1 Tax=Thalassobacillus cyri TaxID=571932 RepID=A0A1H3WH27_9BACI|nr:hypothetical protein [Thalassobacillus cyri]SDZ86403.1 hypothetical protein SAMN05421743_101459 [Thalassobacillus cyri]
MDVNDFLNYYVLGVIIIGLVLVVFGLMFFLYRNKKANEKMLRELEVEAVSTLDKVENEYKHREKEQREKVKKDYEKKVDDFKAYVHDMEKISRTTSEVKTYHILSNLKEKLVTDGKLKPSEMIILPKVFLPSKSEGDISAVKVGHIVLLKTGIYLIDTKEFYGNVLYGITKEKAKDFSFLLNDLFPPEQKETEKTIVFDNKQVNQTGLKVIAVENPAKRVMDGVDYLHPIAEKHTVPGTITPILFVDHHGNQFINHSNDSTPYVFDELETLTKFLVKHLEECDPIYTEEDLEKLRHSIENAGVDKRITEQPV